MHFARTLILWLGLAWLGSAANAQVGEPAGTYSARIGDAVLLIRAIGTRLDLVHPGSNRALSVDTLGTAKGQTGVLPTGEVISFGKVLGRPHLLVGTSLLPLTPVAPAEFLQALGRTQQQPAAPSPVAANTGNTASLGGLSLVYARSRNGYGQLRRYDFCSDGSFYYRFEELQSSQLGNAAGERSDSGRWSLAGQTLQLQFRGRGPASLGLQVRSNDSVSLDGTVYGVERSRRCR